MGNFCTSVAATTRPRPPVRESIALTPIRTLFQRDMRTIRSSVRLTDLPEEMLWHTACKLDAQSYANFRLSCKDVRSALPSPRQINEKIKGALTTDGNLFRLSAQGKLASLIGASNANIRFSIKHGIHRWIDLFEGQPDNLCFVFLFGNHAPKTNTRDRDVIENVLRQIGRDLNGEKEAPPALYRYQDGTDFGQNYAVHGLAVEKEKIDLELLSMMLFSTNRIFEEGTCAEMLITLSVLSHFLTALEEQPDMAKLFDEHRDSMFSIYPELMHCARQLGKWREQKNPDCRYMRDMLRDASSD